MISGRAGTENLTAYALLHEVWENRLPAEIVAEALQIPIRNVKNQVNYFGDRLGTIVTTLDHVMAQPYPSRSRLTQAKQEAAKTLGISVRQLNRFLTRSGVKPRPESIVQRETASKKATERRRLQRILALDVLKGARTLSEAANHAGVHDRTMRRACDNLPVPVRYPDYGKLLPSTRYAVAKCVEMHGDCEHLSTLVASQINRGNEKQVPQMQAKPLLSIMIAWLEGETDQYDPGFEHFFEKYGLKGRKLPYWEKAALADELRQLL